MRDFVKNPCEHWEDWWAWYPVAIYDKKKKGWLRVWCERVQRIRRSNVADTWWEYRLSRTSEEA
jgi:hypothetical protein